MIESITELKKCPFCGGKGNLNLVLPSNDYYVSCGLEYGNCSAIPTTWLYDTELEAINAWNNRVQNL